MLYIHIPYCHQRCSYCAFYSSPTRQGRERYVEAVRKELGDRAPMNADGSPHALRTLYVGGGTPTLLDFALLKRIVETVRQLFDLSGLEETTIEANPEDLTPDYLEQLQSLSLFDRLSIGVQSMEDGELKMLNRRCDSRQVVEAIHNAHQAGFENISIDLIYGLPGSSLGSWEETLRRTEPLMPMVSHLSAYALSVEPSTMLERQMAMGRLTPADEETVMAQYEALQEWCERMGLTQYEISSYCRPGRHSRHNSRYWDRTPYLGVGAAAHSFDGTHRRWNVSDIEHYCTHVLEGGPYADVEELSLRDAHNELLMTALRTTAGIEKALVLRPFAASLAQKMERFVRAGLIVDTPTHYRPTPRGLLQADGIAAALFEEASAEE